MDFAEKFHNKDSQAWAVGHLERELSLKTYLVSQTSATLADLFIYASLKSLKNVTARGWLDIDFCLGTHHFRDMKIEKHVIFARSTITTTRAARHSSSTMRFSP